MRTFARFLELCPNHPFEYDPKRMKYYEKMVEIQEKHALARTVQEDPEITKKRQRLNTLAEDRKIRSISEIPDHVREKLAKLLKYIEQTWKPTTVDLVGSYVTGKYADEATPTEILELRSAVHKGGEYSDFDFVTDQRLVTGKMKLGNLTFELVSQGQHHDSKCPPLRIYDGKPLI